MLNQTNIFDASVDVLSLILFIIILITVFYGTNFQGWYAGRQIFNSLQELEGWRNYGIRLIKKTIEPLRPSTITDRDIDEFIGSILSFFVVAPSELDHPVFDRLHYIMARREKRYHQMVRYFLPNIDEPSVMRITSLIQATTELDHHFKNVKHNLIIGKKTKSYWYLLQTAADITKTMVDARAFRSALDSLIGSDPIGDSVGPMTIETFIKEAKKEKDEPLNTIFDEDSNFALTTVNYYERKCFCLRAIGPSSSIGQPGYAIEKLIEGKFGNLGTEKYNIIITIDSIRRLEGEKSGSVAIGLGAAIGGGANTQIDKFMIESIAIKQNPIIPIEAIVCRQSLEEAVLPMNYAIKSSVPKIIRFLKEIIRLLSKKGNNLIIIGIGNALGINNSN
jgi:hypothetical protein